MPRRVGLAASAVMLGLVLQAQADDPGPSPEGSFATFKAASPGVVILGADEDRAAAKAAALENPSILSFHAGAQQQTSREQAPSGDPSTVQGVGLSVDDLAHLSGHFFDAASPGDGFDFLVVDRGNGSPGIVVWYYGYDTDGTRLWLISDLIIPGNATSFSGEPMFRSTGSGFNGAGNFQQVQWGELDFVSTGCGSATFTLTPNGQASKVMNATQLIDIPGPGCIRPAPRAFQTIAGLSGNWYRPNEPGDGLNVHVANAGLVAFFYGYDQFGNPLWLLTNDPYFGPILPGLQLSFNLITGSGGNLYDVSGANLSNWGTLDLFFTDCTSAEATLIGNDGTKTVSVVQLAQVANSVCEPPGTVQLSQSQVTFDNAGEVRQVSANVFDSLGSPSSSASLQVEVADTGVAQVNSVNNGAAELEAETNTISSTTATFFDPVTNSVEEAEIQVVDFQPNAFVIPVQDVISGNTPLKGQIGEVLLVRNALTESLAATHYIWTEDGLFGQVDSLQLESDQVRIQLFGVTLLEVILNLNLSGGGTMSSAVFAGAPPGSSQPGSVPQRFGPPGATSQIEGASADCSINGDPISIGGYSWDATFDQPGGALTRFYQIVDGVPSSDARIEGRLRLTGEFDIGLPSSPPLGSTVECHIANLMVQTPSTPLWGPYSGGIIFPVDVSLEFTLQNAPPDPLLNFQWGVEPIFEYQFATQELDMTVLTGLSGARVANFGQSVFSRVPGGSDINVMPAFSGPLGLYGDGPRADFEQMDLIRAEFDFPLDVAFEGPEDFAHPLFRGPQHLLSIGIFSEQDVDGASPLLDPLGFDRPDLPVETLLGPDMVVLRGSPELEMVELDCGNQCGVGDPRQFAISLSRPSLINRNMTGELGVFRLQQFAQEGTSNYVATELGSTVFTGQTPITLIFEFTPDSGGFWEIAPRFNSWDHGGDYGGPSVTFQVDDEACLLNVDVEGSGSVNSDPGGISCPEDCSEVYDFGTQVFLGASAASGWAFDSWSGQCDATDGPSCFVVMECARSVTANFIQIPQ